MVKYWLHNGFITINQEKMSKSLNNFFLVKDILALYKPDALRYFLLSTHYRSPLDFSDERLKEMTRSLERLGTSIDNVLFLAQQPGGAGSDESRQLLADAQKIEEDYMAAMCDDFNTALASAAMFELAKKINIYKDAVVNNGVPCDPSTVSEVKRIFRTMDVLSGLRVTDPEELVISREEFSDIELKMNEILSDLEWQVLNSYLDGKSYNEMSLELHRHDGSPYRTAP